MSEIIEKETNTGARMLWWNMGLNILYLFYCEVSQSLAFNKLIENTVSNKMSDLTVSVFMGSFLTIC
jgi:hypothetical protein